MKKLLFLLVLTGLIQGVGTAHAQERAVTVVRVDGAITPITMNYIERGLNKALADSSQILIVELDTPGGLLESTKDIVQLFLDSALPVVVYVSPEGASAASAGTFITMAAHIAAMAPTTTIGAASPVQMTPGGGGVEPDTVMQKKIFAYSESFIESIANRRGRNAEWAVSAVRDGESVTADRALALDVIDLIASDREDLLGLIDGRVVEGDTLRTAGASIRELPPNLAERFFGFLLRPEVMLILMLVAVYGIIGEVSNPGAIVPGVAGVMALILLLYASAAMPINVAGYALLVLAVILFSSEAFTPTFGLLTSAGAVAFFLGLLLLFQDFPQALSISWAWFIPATVIMALFFMFIAGAGLKMQLASTRRTGGESMVGKRADVVDTVDSSGGRVYVAGEYWNAVSDVPIDAGSTCEILAIRGLTLTVAPDERTVQD